MSSFTDERTFKKLQRDSVTEPMKRTANDAAFRYHRILTLRERVCVGVAGFHLNLQSKWRGIMIMISNLRTKLCIFSKGFFWEAEEGSLSRCCRERIVYCLSKVGGKLFMWELELFSGTSVRHAKESL
jgi:hypothetical protein